MESPSRSSSDGVGIGIGRTLPRKDSLDVESSKIRRGGPRDAEDGRHWAMLLKLAFQSIGVVYGDIGTSPLYVYASVFSDGIHHHDDILGVLSLIFYTLTLIPLLKYVFIILRANDNGDGGTFALYSLICRYAKVGLVPNQEVEDRNVSNYRLPDAGDHRFKRASYLKSILEKSNFAKMLLLLATMLGTSMLIGDGVLTPCISVLSAVGGIKEATPNLTQDWIVWISVLILILLFMVQRFGTGKVGYTFAPILCIWFAFIAAIGAYNIFKHDPSVLKALNPVYIVYYFRRNKLRAWISLGGVILCTTGAEALFADVGHFSVRSIQISMCTAVYLPLLLSYAGQASYLRKHELDVADAFYRAIPGPLYWPMFVVAVLAAIIASQSLISGTFSIIQQSLALGCFPRVKVVHTSSKHAGQVYVPEMNYLLMLSCIALTLLFRDTIKIGNAYGIAVVFVMVLSSAYLVLIMIMIWKVHFAFIVAYVVTIGAVELIYLSSVLYKFDQGGYLPLAFASVLMAIMYTWHDVYRRKYLFELKNKISPEKIKEMLLPPPDEEEEDRTRFVPVTRLPGVAMFYSELVHGIPPIFEHYLRNVAAVHSVLVFVSIKSLPVSRVPPEERFLFRKVQPEDLRVFRCVARYGYMDAVRKEEEEAFERLLIRGLRDFLGDEGSNAAAEMVGKAAEYKVVHLIGEHDVVAGEGSKVWKRALIDYVYSFLKRNLRGSNKVLDIPHDRMIKVGMVYQL